MTSYRCAVMGNPIAHSQSPEIHANFAKAHGIELVYDKILVPIDGLPQAVSDFYATNQAKTPLGLNVTLPFKVDAYELADKLSDHANYAGAVNTLYLQDGALVGDNTDGVGLCRALTHTHGHTLKDKSVLLIGAGGAARGAIYPLLQAGIAQLTIANRTLPKAQALIDMHQALSASTLQALPLADINQGSFDFIINATSIGLSDNRLTLPPTLLHAQTVCYDMVYGKQTAFMEWAQQHGAKHVHDGYSMLVEQARCSFMRWFGV